MKKLIIFDLDGTLIDTPSGIVEAFQNVFNNLENQTIDQAKIRNTIGLPLEKAFSNLLDIPLNDAKILQAIDLYQNAFSTIILPKAEKLIFPGVVEGLQILQETGYELAIATSKYYASADKLLKAAKIRDYFKVVLGADQVEKPKPNPEMGLKIIEEFGIPAEDVLMIGDTSHDIKMANNASIKSIAVTYGIHNKDILESAGATWIKDTFKEVIDHIKKNNTQYA